MGEKPQKSHSLVQVVFWATECVENDFGFKFLLRLRNSGQIRKLLVFGPCQFIMINFYYQTKRIEPANNKNNRNFGLAKFFGQIRRLAVKFEIVRVKEANFSVSTPSLVDTCALKVPESLRRSAYFVPYIHGIYDTEYRVLWSELEFLIRAFRNYTDITPSSDMMIGTVIGIFLN